MQEGVYSKRCEEMKNITIKVILSIMIVTTLLTGSTKAYIVHSECVDSDTLWEYVNMTVEGTELDIDLGTVDCPYGCIEDYSAFGDDCRENYETKQLDVGLVGMWGMIWVLAFWLWTRKWYKLSAPLMLANSLGGALITTNIILIIPIAFSLMMTLWVFGLIKTKGEWLRS